MSYKDRFYNWRHDETAQAHPYITFYRPESMYSLDDIQRRDGYAASDIDTLQKIIADLQEYRRDLAARYAELATMTYTYKLYLVREKSWCTKKVSYTVRLARVLPDGKEIDERREDFQGTDRKKAFELFAKLKKERPGIEAIQDTEKRQWEK